MIIKLVHKCGWVIYDNIVKLRYEHEITDLSICKKSDTEHCPDAIWINEPLKNGDSLIKMYARLWDDKEMYIVASDSVYLCNDEGKTIEKIN